MAVVQQAVIRLPGSPFWNVFRRFGRDEAIALLVSLVGTLAISQFTTSTLLLALVGPVIEKIGFFPAHFWEAHTLYRGTPKDLRKPLSSYVKTAMKGGSLSLVEDILIHDPLYVGLFFVLSTYTLTPIWAITILSFVAAVWVVAYVEVGCTKARYWYLQHQLHALSFDSDHYREARFFIQSEEHSPETIIRKLKEGLGLEVIETLTYEDRYFETGLPAFAGRSPILRLRKRTAGKCSVQRTYHEHVAKTGFMQSLQLVYTLPQEEVTKQLGQFRYYSVLKDKFFYHLHMEMPHSPSEISDTGVRQFVRAGREYKHLRFERTIMLDSKKLLYVGIDRNRDNHSGCIVIELKIRKDVPLLIAAMEFVMRELPVVHTTQQKTELALF